MKKKPEQCQNGCKVNFHKNRQQSQTKKELLLQPFGSIVKETHFFLSDL